MKKIVMVMTMSVLAACTTGNDGYKVQDVWESGGQIHARADATDKSETLCLNRARINARDKVSNFVVTKYSGKDMLKINNANENFSSNRESETKSLFNGAKYLIKPWDKKTRTCGVELIVETDNVEGLIEE